MTFVRYNHTAPTVSSLGDVLATMAEAAARREPVPQLEGDRPAQVYQRRLRDEAAAHALAALGLAPVGVRTLLWLDIARGKHVLKLPTKCLN